MKMMTAADVISERWFRLAALGRNKWCLHYQFLKTRHLTNAVPLPINGFGSPPNLERSGECPASALTLLNGSYKSHGFNEQ
jgi:hypothetical protein